MRSRRDREPHASARPVADVADRIDIFVRRTRGHDHPAAAQHRVARREDALGRRHHVLRLREASLPDPAAGEVPLARLDEAGAARGERLQVPPHGVVLEHVRVHRRGDQHRRLRCQVQRREEVVRDPVGKLADDVRGAWRDQQQADLVGNRDVLDGTPPRKRARRGPSLPGVRTGLPL